MLSYVFAKMGPQIGLQIKHHAAAQRIRLPKPQADPQDDAQNDPQIDPHASI